MRSTLLAVPLFLLSAHDLANAARLALRGRPRTRHSFGDLARRANISGTTSVSDIGDVQYDTDITLGGQTFTVQIDTGRYVAIPADEHRECGSVSSCDDEAQQPSLCGSLCTRL